MVESSKSYSEAETDEEIEERFAKLREERAKVTDAFGNKTCEDVWDNTTQEELEYYKRKNLERSPEERYQIKKQHWYFHKSSWYMRGVKSGYDGHGCCDGVCVPECRFYRQCGRIEDEEVLGWYERRKNDIQS